MNPCPNNKRDLALLAADALDPQKARELREHFNDCAGCRQYWQEIALVCRQHSAAGDGLAQAQPSASFHQKLVRRIANDQARPVYASMLEKLRRLVIAVS